VADTFDLLDEQVDGLGGAVGAAAGGMPGKDFDLPGSHGTSQSGQLSDLDAIAPVVEAVQRGPGGRRASRGVDGPQQFFALSGDGDLTGGISSRQAGP
jgi:hypothetical protein